MQNTKSKIKPIKIGKQPGTTYCFGCKDYTQNFILTTDVIKIRWRHIA